MSWFRDLSLRTKLLASFGGVLVMTVVLGITLLAQLGSVNSGGAYIAGNSVPSIEVIGQIQSDENAYRADQMWNITNTNVAYSALPTSEIRADERAIVRGFDRYRAMISNATDGALMLKARSQWTSYVSDTQALNLAASNTTQPPIVKLADSSALTFKKLRTTPAAWVALNDGIASQQARANSSTFGRARLLGIAVMLLAILLGAVIAFVLSRYIGRSTAEMVRAADGIAAGDIDQRLSLVSRDELGQTAAAFSRMVEYLKEQAGVAGALADGDLTVEPQPRSERDLLGNALRVLVTNLRATVGKIASTAQAVSSSSQQLTATSGESGRVAEESGRAVEEIAAAVGEVALNATKQVETVEQVRGAAEEVSRAIEEIAFGANTQVEAVDQVRIAAAEVGRAIADIAQGVEEQVNAVELVSASARQVVGAVETATQAAKATALAAQDTREVARAGVAAAEDASEAMSSVRHASQEVNTVINELASKSEQIGEIVATITGIAEQTNLLALNAAIEAARAGEQGRGFAVVAEEVRKLAEESQSAASEISTLITAIQGQTLRAVEVVQDGAQRTEEGVAVVSQTKAAFLQIGDAVESMTARIDEIAVISEQIASNARTMQDTVESVAAVAERTAASAQQVSASAEQVTASADQVAASAEQSSAAAEQVSASAEEVSASADQVAAMAQEASAATQQVSASTQEVSACTEESSAAAQQVAASAKALSENAELLAELVAQFKVTQSEAIAAV